MRQVVLGSVMAALVTILFPELALLWKAVLGVVVYAVVSLVITWFLPSRDSQSRSELKGRLR
ncbi:hypothetical protein [Bounagaea algeriensis]